MSPARKGEKLSSQYTITDRKEKVPTSCLQAYLVKTDYVNRNHKLGRIKRAE